MGAGAEGLTQVAGKGTDISSFAACDADVGMGQVQGAVVRHMDAATGAFFRLQFPGGDAVRPEIQQFHRIDPDPLPAQQVCVRMVEFHPFPKRFEGTAGQFIPREAEKPSAPTDTDEAQ